MAKLTQREIDLRALREARQGGVALKVRNPNRPIASSDGAKIPPARPVEVAAAGKEPIRVTFPMPPGLHDRIQEYRFRQRCGSLSEAIRILLERGLKP